MRVWNQKDWPAFRVLEKRARRGWFPEDYPLVRKAFAVAEERRQWRREDREFASV